MAVQKLSISLETSLVGRARHEAEAAGQTMSSFVGEALEYRLKLEAARHLLADWEAENGPITGAERDQARSQWQA